MKINVFLFPIVKCTINFKTYKIYNIGDSLTQSCMVFMILYILVLERTVRCSRTVWFFVMFDMFEVRFWAKMWCSEVFEVRSSCYVTRLVLEHTVSCSQTVQFFVMFDMFEVQFWAKMWCSEVFEVRSCCYVTRLVLEHTVWCLWTVRFFVMFEMF